jgi:Domain of unknown function (DUF4185)
MPDVVRGKTGKLVQLVGESDCQTGRPPPQTFTKYGLYGTDLGTPLDFGPGGPLWFLFGDAWTATREGDRPKPALLNAQDAESSKAFSSPYNRFHPFNADPVGVAPSHVTAENLDTKFELMFFIAPKPHQDQGYATLEIPGVNLLTDQVPTGAINTPSGVYVFATGKPFPPRDDVIGDASAAARAAVGVENVQCSWVARWSDLTTLKTEPPYQFSAGRFANYLVPVVGGVNDGTGTPGHPTKGEVVWLWGTGFPNRESPVRLAYAPLTSVGDKQSWRFFCRTDRGGFWVKEEARATPLFNCPAVGEFSVAWNKYLGLWLMLYGCSDPRGILCRWAAEPWGPWSDGITIFEPWEDNGYRHFMHAPNQDALSDPGRENDWGGEYAPIMIPRYTLGSDGMTKIRYTMSTWNPYTVVIMETELWLRSWHDRILINLSRAWQNIFMRSLSSMRL